MKFIKIIGNILSYFIIWLIIMNGMFFLTSFMIPEAVFKQNICIVVSIASLTTLFMYEILLFIRKESLLKVCQFSKTDMINVGASIIIGICYSFVILYVYNIFKIPNSNSGILNDLFDTNKIIFFLSVCVISPIFEEILFRGLIVYELKKIAPKFLAIVIQAILFALTHGIVMAFFAFVLGILLSLVYLWVKSIWAPILVHIAINGFNLYFKEIILHNQINSIYLFAGVISIIIILYYLRETQKHKNQINQEL